MRNALLSKYVQMTMLYSMLSAEKVKVYHNLGNKAVM